MAGQEQDPASIFDINFQTRTGTLVLVVVLAATILARPAAEAQTLSVLHPFTSGVGGAYPSAGLSMDRAGNLYGTASEGGVVTDSCPNGCGTVFKLSLKNSSWVLSPLYSFQGGTDGLTPNARVTIGPDGNLYGTTLFGGQGNCIPGPRCGVVFRLSPPARACTSFLCPWMETILHSFAGGADGGQPAGDLSFDQAGNLYGSTTEGGYTGGVCGTYGCGAVYKLTPSDGGWTESVLYAFQGASDGQNPSGGVIPDGSGNLYGSTATGGNYQCEGYSCGTVFELSPSGSGWTKNILHMFQESVDGGFPFGGLIMDGSGNLYGTTSSYGPNGGGTIFELLPSDGSWSFSLVYALRGGLETGPWGDLAIDAAGNLYGATKEEGQYGYGSVFSLVPANGSWLYRDLHDFYDQSDGGFLFDGLVLDSQGNVYGTAHVGGTYGYGLVFEITP
jgi:uncharacterized repeat protein (TIGR03803 family)